MIIFNRELNPFHSYKIHCETEYFNIIVKYLLDKDIKIDDLVLRKYEKLLHENKFIYIMIDYFTNDREGYFKMNFVNTFSDCFDLDIHSTIVIDTPMKIEILKQKIKIF